MREFTYELYEMAGDVCAETSFRANCGYSYNHRALMRITDNNRRIRRCVKKMCCLATPTEFPVNHFDYPAKVG